MSSSNSSTLPVVFLFIALLAVAAVIAFQYLELDALKELFPAT